MRAARKLILGETWTLPAAIAVSLAIAGVADALSNGHGWWQDAGGFVLLALVLAGLALALRPARR